MGTFGNYAANILAKDLPSTSIRGSIEKKKGSSFMQPVSNKNKPVISLGRRKLRDSNNHFI